MFAERLVRRQGSSCMLSKGSRARPLSRKRLLTSSSPSWLVRLRSFMAKGSSLPYTMLASTKEVSALIWFRMVMLLLGQAGQERKKGMQSRWFLMRGSLGGICSTEGPEGGGAHQGQGPRSGVALPPPRPVHPPEGLDPTSEASWSPGPDGATQTLKGSSSTPSARSEASQGPQRDQPEFHQQRASELEG